MEVHNDDDGEETDDSADQDDSGMSHADASDDDAMARTVSTLLGKARQTLGIHTNVTRTNGWSNEESQRSGWTAAASAAASLSLPPTNAPPPEEHDGQKEGEERNGRRGATAAGAMPPTAVAVASIWQRQEKVLRVMNQKRNDILVSPAAFSPVSAV